MASAEVSWATAYWSLVAVALNTMMQPCGSVCGFEASLQIYLRSSPFVCVFDAIAILYRFTIYLIRSRSIVLSAKRVLAARNFGASAQSKGDKDPETPLIFRLAAFVFGVGYSFSKIMACSGVPWTKMWALFYLSSFVAVFTMTTIAGLAKKEKRASEDIRHEGAIAAQELTTFRGDEEEVTAPGHKRQLDTMDRIDMALGYTAILLQIIILSWIDLAAIPPSKDLAKRYLFHLYRFGGHAMAIIVHFICASFQAEGTRSLIAFRQRASPALLLLIICVLATIHILDLRYTQMYHYWSIIVAITSWLLFSFPKSKNLVCVSGAGDYTNVVAFDFFCRVFSLSLFWYTTCYNPVGTLLPEWADFFG